MASIGTPASPGGDTARIRASGSNKLLRIAFATFTAATTTTTTTTTTTGKLQKTRRLCLLLLLPFPGVFLQGAPPPERWGT